MISRRFEWGVAVAAAAAILLLLVLRWPAPMYEVFNSNSTIDSAFFAFAGEIIRSGGTPYLDFWDHKPPLVHLIDAGVLAVSGGRVWGLWLATLAAFLGALALLHVALRRAFGTAAALAGDIFLAFSLFVIVPFNLTEGYVLPLQCATALLVVSWQGDDAGAFRRGVVLGLLGALAFLLRQNLIGAAVAATLALSVVLLREGAVRAWLRLAGGAALGAVLPVATLVAWLAPAGALDAFWEQAMVYNFLYTAVSIQARIRAAFQGLALSTLYGTILIPFAGWLLAAARVLGGGVTRASLPVVFGVLWVPTELALASLSGREYAHYFAALLPPLAYVTGIAIAEAIRVVQAGVPPDRHSVWARGAIAFFFIGVAVFPVGRVLLEVRDVGLVSDRGTQVSAVATYLRENSGPESPVLVWGHASDVHLLAARRAASRYVYALPLLTPGYADSALIGDFLHDLEASAPPIIVDAAATGSGSEGLVPPLGEWDPNWQYPDGGLAYWKTTPALKAVYDFVAANYALADSVGPERWPVYRRLATNDARAPVSVRVAQPRVHETPVEPER